MSTSATRPISRSSPTTPSSRTRASPWKRNPPGSKPRQRWTTTSHKHNEDEVKDVHLSVGLIHSCLAFVVACALAGFGHWQQRRARRMAMNESDGGDPAGFVLMPAYQNLSDQDLGALADYLESLK